jgi:hypothetical protein
MSFVYLHCRPTGEPFYVGKGTFERAHSFKPRNNHYKNVVYKYGSDNVLIGTLECSSDKIAFELERGIIECLRRQGERLSNINDGGEGFCTGHIPWHKGSKGLVKPWNQGKKTGPQNDEVKAKKSAALRGFKHVEKTCPYCGKIGAGGSMKRWHFDNCKGVAGSFRARITVNGKRIHLGRFATQEDADGVMLDAYNKFNIPLPKEFLLQRKK